MRRSPALGNYLEPRPDSKLGLGRCALPDQEGVCGKSLPSGPRSIQSLGPGSGMYDAALKGPEIINERMAATQAQWSLEQRSPECSSSG